MKQLSIFFLSIITAVNGFCQSTAEFEPFDLSIQVLATPTFADIDDDGDLDLIAIGYNFKHYNKIFVQENIGTNQSPQFAEPAFQPYGLTQRGISSPTFVDIDSDGDLDLFCHGYNGKGIFVQLNIGTKESPQFSEPELEPYEIDYYKSLSTPTFADIDDDGDYDLISVNGGYNKYVIHIQENVGTKELPSFADPIEQPFGLTELCLTPPKLIDIDNDGDLDLLGNGTHRNACKIFVQKNVGTKRLPEFSEPEFQPYGLIEKSYSSPVFVDINGDGKFDCFGEGTYGKRRKIFFQENIVIDDWK